MTRYYFGQWQWFPDWRGRGLAGHGPPNSDLGAYSSLDFRGDAQSEVPNSGGFGIFAYPSAQINPLLLVDLGEALDAPVTLLARELIEISLGLQQGAILSRSLRPMLEELTTIHVDPSGINAHAPLTGNQREGFRVTLSGNVISRRAELADELRERDVFREAYRRERQKLSNGDRVLASLQRWTGAKMLRLGVTDPAEVLPPEFVSDGFRRPGSLRRDTFVEGSSDTNLESHTPTGNNAGASWTKISGSGVWQVKQATDDLRGQSTGTTAVAYFRINNVLSDNSIHVKFNVDQTGGVDQHGPLTRIPTGASPAADFYENRMHTDAGEMNIFRFNGGTPTFGNGGSVTFSLPDDVEMDTSSGGVHDAILNGSSQLTWSNNQLTSNQHAGIRCFHETAGDAIITNFLADDGVDVSLVPPLRRRRDQNQLVARF